MTSLVSGTSLKPRFDYWQATVFEAHDLVLSAMLSLAVEAPAPAPGHHGYGLGVSIPTRDRGTLTVHPPGIHEWPSVRVSGWPSESVVGILRRWSGQVSRVDAAVDLGSALGPWASALKDLAVQGGIRHASYAVGGSDTGVELGSGQSESRTRCYDAVRAHPGEWPEGSVVTRLEHEWKPASKARKRLAWGMTPDEVLGVSRPASKALRALSGVVLPVPEPRTARQADLDRWVEWFRDSQGARLRELLARCGGDVDAAMSALLGDEEMQPAC